MRLREEDFAMCGAQEHQDPVDELGVKSCLEDMKEGTEDQSIRGAEAVMGRKRGCRGGCNYYLLM